MPDRIPPPPPMRWHRLFALIALLDVAIACAGVWTHGRVSSELAGLAQARTAWREVANAMDGLGIAVSEIPARATGDHEAELDHARLTLARRLTELTSLMDEPGDTGIEAETDRLLPAIGRAIDDLRAAAHPLQDGADAQQRLVDIIDRGVAAARAVTHARVSLRSAYERSYQARTRRMDQLRTRFGGLLIAVAALSGLVAGYGLLLVRRARRQELAIATSLDALAASEVRKTAVIAAAQDGIVLLDQDGRITEFNPAAERMFARRSAEVAGRPAIDLLLAPTVQEDWRRALARWRATGEAKHLGQRLETTAVRADDGEFPVELSVAPVRLGAQAMFVAHVRDIGERKAQELAMLRSNRELEQFAYIASHDLQEPLRMVSGYLALLEKRYRTVLDDKARDFIGHAVDGAERMHALINDLLAYSRVDRHEISRDAVPLREALDEALEFLRPKLAEAGAEVTAGELPTVVGDRVQLVQLFQNLVGNAVKYRGDEPPGVRIDATRDGDSWRVAVRDNGIGIDPVHHERIFEIFQRLHTRSEYPGTGIGLAICKKIVERHGGRIGVDSEPGRGATFWFTIADQPAAG